jgi:hypothetical protein
MPADELEPRDESNDFSQRLDSHLAEIRKGFDAFAAGQQRIIKLLDTIIDDRQARS